MNEAKIKAQVKKCEGPNYLWWIQIGSRNVPIECNAHVFSKRAEINSALRNKMHFKFIQIIKISSSVIPALTRAFTFSPKFNPNSSFGSSCFRNIVFLWFMVKMGDVLVNVDDNCMTHVKPLSKTYMLPYL